MRHCRQQFYAVDRVNAMNIRVSLIPEHQNYATMRYYRDYAGDVLFHSGFTSPVANVLRQAAMREMTVYVNKLSGDITDFTCPLR